MKSPLRLPRPERTVTRYCEVRGCTQTTREGKPYCSDHVEHHPYVQALIAELKAQEDEADASRTKGYKAVDVESTVSKEILRILAQNGPRTEERLAREIHVDAQVMEAYIQALLHKQYVTLGQTNRGNTVIRLVKTPSQPSKHPD